MQMLVVMCDMQWSTPESKVRQHIHGTTLSCVISGIQAGHIVVVLSCILLFPTGMSSKYERWQSNELYLEGKSLPKLCLTFLASFIFS